MKKCTFQNIFCHVSVYFFCMHKIFSVQKQKKIKTKKESENFACTQKEENKALKHKQLPDSNGFRMISAIVISCLLHIKYNTFSIIRLQFTKLCCWKCVRSKWIENHLDRMSVFFKLFSSNLQLKGISSSEMLKQSQTH